MDHSDCIVCQMEETSSFESPEQLYSDSLGVMVAMYVLSIVIAIVMGIALFGFSLPVVAISAFVGYVPVQWFMTPHFKTLFKHRPATTVR